MNRRPSMLERLERRKDLLGGVLLFLPAFLIFWLSPIHVLADSRYALFFSQRLLRNHTLSAESSAFPQTQSRQSGQIPERGSAPPYQLMQLGERFYYWYPPGTSILSMPFVAVANAAGISAITPDGRYNPPGESQMEAALAAILMGGLTVIVFYTSRLLLSLNWSLLVAVTTALGTPVWSTASRATWSHTWGIFILSLVVWQILRAEAKRIRLRPIVLATCLSWLYFCRPTFSSSIVAVAIYVLIYHRSVFLSFALTGCAWLAAFIGWSEYVYGTFLPRYYWQDNLRFTLSFEALAANLVSPARGLLAYVPILFGLAYLLVRYRRCLKKRLVVLALGVIAFHIIYISGFTPWHAGHSYGPRLTTDLIPWFALLGILALRARLQWREENPERGSPLFAATGWAVTILLLLGSITLNGIGALSQYAWLWNVRPMDIDKSVERVWDWKHPQFVPWKSRPRRALRPNDS